MPSGCTVCPKCNDLTVEIRSRSGRKSCLNILTCGYSKEVTWENSTFGEFVLAHDQRKAMEELWNRLHRLEKLSARHESELDLFRPLK